MGVRIHVTNRDRAGIRPPPFIPTAGRPTNPFLEPDGPVHVGGTRADTRGLGPVPGPDGGPAHLRTFRPHERTGRPLGGDGFITHLEAAVGRLLRRQKSGPQNEARREISMLSPAFSPEFPMQPNVRTA